MNKYYFEFDKDDIPKYIQLALKIKKLIDSDAIEDGEKLPSIRKLADDLDVNKVTIVNAYKKLENEGYASQKIGSGTYAKRKETVRNFKREFFETLKGISGESLKEYIDFNGETACGDFFPVDTFKKVLNEVLDRDGSEAFIYQEALGYQGLRKSIDEFFWHGEIGTENILIVSGAQQGIDIISKALVNVDDGVMLEKPTYSGALSVFKWRRANIFEIDMEEDGLNINQLEKIVKKNKIKCLYLMSYFQNPTGITYSIEKKKELLRLAERYDFYIIEDDYLSELIYTSDISYISLKSMDKYDRVIYIKSFSKMFLPGIRIGYMIPPKKFKESIQNSKVNTDISTSSLMQRALDLYIRNGYWKEHIETLNRAYYDKYFFMENYLNETVGDKVSFHCPKGGLNFYLKINGNVKGDSMELFRRCKDNKVLIAPGVLFYRNNTDGEKYFRLGFSQTSINDIKNGIDIINDCLEALGGI